jgi:hypothetical protein
MHRHLQGHVELDGYLRDGSPADLAQSSQRATKRLMHPASVDLPPKPEGSVDPTVLELNPLFQPWWDDSYVVRARRLHPQHHGSG